MVSAPAVAVALTFRDRDSNRAVATSYCPIGAPTTAIWDYAYALGATMQSLSNGILAEIKLTWRYTIDSPATPATDSTNERKLLMLMLNDDMEINGIIVPSPDSAIFETTGAYAGIRLDLASAGALGWIDMLASMDLRTDDNRAVGTELAAGGLAL